MRTTLVSSLLCVILASGAALAAEPSPAPSATPGSSTPPTIYRATVRPLCSALRSKIAPSVGMMLQNDQSIAKSPKLFNDYSRASFDADPNANPNEATAAQSFAVYSMNRLVGPIADNLVAIQKMLNDPTVFPAHPSDADTQRLADLKKKLLIALADQQASLDIISGFVDTQQLGQMQHAGFGYISTIMGGDITGSQAKSRDQELSNIIGATPDPMHPDAFDNTALQAGLNPNPYELDLTRLPGLTLGYNPLNHLTEGLKWTQKQAAKNEQTLANSIFEAAHLCNAKIPAAPAPAPSPSP
ncbi:MAG: hypothetical protein KGN02_11160 [bacterium]|nr:hypothetical protein [bacterium]